MTPIGLYLHIPYCLHKCGYCDFNSHNIDEGEMQAYVRALLAELEVYGKRAKNRAVATVFFGGGTPTTLPSADLARILEACRAAFPLAEGAEISLEANPATIPQSDLEQLRQAGFNRLSIGVQSFDPDELQRLERVHTVDEVYLTVERARTAGFDNLSLDLMFGLPGQTLQRWQDNLNQALGLSPEHLSAYNLTIEPGTTFHKQQAQGRLDMPPDDFQRELFEITIATLTGAGYEHYEISNYAQPGRQCRHNLHYWTGGDFIGLGAGASSAFKGSRYQNASLPARYIAQIRDMGDAVETREQPTPAQQMGEFVMLGLRLRTGLSLSQFQKQFGISFQEAFGETVDRLKKLELITLSDDQLSLTRQGLFLADSVIVEFITEPEPTT